jgi:hypothetical protein
MPRDSSVKIEVPIVFLKDSSTGKAFKAILLDRGGVEVSRNWLPHSQVTTDEGMVVEGHYGKTVRVMIPLWLLEKELIDSYYVDELGEEAPEELNFRAE